MAPPADALIVLHSLPESRRHQLNNVDITGGLLLSGFLLLYSLDVLDDLQSDVLQAAAKLRHLRAQRRHAAQHLVQLVPKLLLLLWGQTLHHGLHRRQSLPLGLQLWRRS